MGHNGGDELIEVAGGGRWLQISILKKTLRQEVWILDDDWHDIIRVAYMKS